MEGEPGRAHSEVKEDNPKSSLAELAGGSQVSRGPYQHGNSSDFLFAQASFYDSSHPHQLSASQHGDRHSDPNRHRGAIAQGYRNDKHSATMEPNDSHESSSPQSQGNAASLEV